MPDELYTVEAAAGRLKLHVKTLQRFIREGRLRATKVGRSYRILRSDLEALAGAPAIADRSAGEARATSIVDVPGVNAELARRVQAWVDGAARSRAGRGGPLRSDVIYEADRRHLKIVLVGSPTDTATMLHLLHAWLET